MKCGSGLSCRVQQMYTSLARDLLSSTYDDNEQTSPEVHAVRSLSITVSDVKRAKGNEKRRTWLLRRFTVLQQSCAADVRASKGDPSFRVRLVLPRWRRKRGMLASAGCECESSGSDGRSTVSVDRRCRGGAVFERDARLQEVGIALHWSHRRLCVWVWMCAECTAFWKNKGPPGWPKKNEKESCTETTLATRTTTGRRASCRRRSVPSNRRDPAGRRRYTSVPGSEELSSLRRALCAWMLVLVLAAVLLSSL